MDPAPQSPKDESAILGDDSLPVESPPGKQAVRFEYSPLFPRLLEQLGASLLVSTYQAGKLCVVGVRQGQLTFAFHNFDRVMGVAVSPRRIAVGARRQIYSLYPAHDFAPRIEPSGTHDACWLARTSFVTGSIHGHDLAWGDGGLWVVNTLFSCLCTLHDDYNFVPRWRPLFVKELIDQDRCHLNGVALENGHPRFVTAMAESNEPAGWRPTKATSGCVIDVPSGETIVRGLAMPHSPRLFGGKLWVLDSGKGMLSVVDQASGRVEPVEAMPGYTRGLAFCGQFAFVGLSKIRETAVFSGVPIAERRDELRCGVGVVDLRTGRTVATLQFHSGVEEIFAVEVLPGTMNPRLCGPAVDEDDMKDIWVVPAPVAAGSMTARPGPQSLVTQSPAIATAGSGAGAAPDARSLTRSGAVLHEQGRLVEALDRLRQAIELDPANAEALNHLGNLRQDLGEPDAALACYRRAVAAQPGYAPALQNLGYVLAARGDPDDALRNFKMAQQAQPQPMNKVLAAMVLPIIYDSMADVQRWRHRLVEQVRGLVRDGVRIDTTRTLTPTSFFFAYQGENDRDLMRDLASIYQGVECCRPAGDPAARARGKRIKVGFLSSYFREHTMGALNLGRIEHLSREQFEVTVVSGTSPRDKTGERFRTAGDRFVVVPRQVETARKQIAGLDLDILLFTDVGMDALTQTLGYSRMAPVQCVTWGHPSTTGSPAMDHFISSDLLELPDAEQHYTERLVRLPNLGVFYHRPELTEPRRSREFFGLSADRHLYLCPQTLFKFHPGFDPVLAGILDADPKGELVVIEGRTPNWTERLRRRWARILPDAARRVRFLPAQPRSDFLQLLALADVMLDPFPFGGGNTSYEAFAVGTPVITWPGRYLRGRITQALYRKMGLETGTVGSASEYVMKAVRLGTDNAVRQAAREQIFSANHVLYEDKEEVRALEEFFLRVVGGGQA